MTSQNPNEPYKTSFTTPMPSQQVTKKQTYRYMSKRNSHKRYALKPLNNAMRDVIVRKRWANRIQDVRIVDDWEQVVGALMATHVVPQWIKNRVLYVQASDPHWATFVTYEKPKIVEKINQHFTENTVENIVVITKETHKPSQSKNLGL